MVTPERKFQPGAFFVQEGHFNAVHTTPLKGNMKNHSWLSIAAGTLLATTVQAQVAPAINVITNHTVVPGKSPTQQYLLAHQKHGVNVWASTNSAATNITGFSHLVSASKRVKPTASIAKTGPYFNVWAISQNSSNSVAAKNKGGSKVVELASGMNYWDGQKWSPSEPAFQISADGATLFANKVQHKIRLTANINSVDSVDITTPDGIELQTTPAAIGLFDAASGNSLIIGTVTNSIATLVNSNQVIYENAFNGVAADIVYTLKRGSFEQDVILKQNLNPADYGFPTNTTQIQILTEFFNPPQPAEIVRPLSVEKDPSVRRRMASPDFIDRTLKFGQLTFGRGKSYTAAATNEVGGAPVAKDFRTIAGRSFLIESAQYRAVRRNLESLPRGAAVSMKSKTSKNGYASIPVFSQNAKGFVVSKRAPIRVATELSRSVLVLDYLVVLGGAQPDPMVFQSDTTYFISGPVYCWSAIFEGGTVIKYPNDTTAFIQADAGVTCQSSEYQPAIFTAGDDDTVGDSLWGIWFGYRGTINGGYANPAVISYGGQALKNVRISYAQIAAQLGGDGASVISHSQLINCIQGIAWNGSSTTSLTMNNCLAANTGLLISDSGSYEGGGYGSGSVFTLNNCTIDNSSILLDNSGFNDPYDCGDCWDNFSGYGQDTIEAVNCIFSNIGGVTDGDPNSVALDGSNNGFDSSISFGQNQYFAPAGGPIYNSSGNGSYYLPANSPFRGVGTTAIDPSILADLKTRTTQPPIALPALMEMAGDLTLFAQIPRYAGGPPDLGYYYPALDYTIATMVLEGGKVTVLPGVAIAVRNDYIASQGLWALIGFFAEGGSSIVAHGTPTLPITFTSTKMVQEEPETAFTRYQISYGLPCSVISFVPYYQLNAANSPAPTFDFRFCNFSLSAQDYHIWGGCDETLSIAFSLDSALYLGLRDCNLYGGRFNLGKTYDESTVFGAGSISLVNNLFDRVAINIEPDWFDYGDPSIYLNLALQAHNNLFRGGPWLHLAPLPAAAGNNWLFEDNLFDQVDFYQDVYEPLDYDYNAYWPLTTLNGNGDTAELVSTTTGDGFSDGSAGNHEVVLSSAPPYQSGPLGSFYLPPTTSLYNAGSRASADAGLAQYTTQANQAKDIDKVDIGLHYVATASFTSATPLDTDGDRIPDYVEDANGDGVVDGGETDPTLAMTDEGTRDALSGAYDDVDLDGDGLCGAAERLFVTDPLVSDNPLDFSHLNVPDTVSGILIIPLNINPNIDLSLVSLMVNGIKSDTSIYKDNNVWYGKWDTMGKANGMYTISFELNLGDEDGNMSLMSSKIVTVQNDICFPDNLAICGSALYVNAQTVNANGTWTMNVFDDQGNLFISLSGNVDANGFLIDPNGGEQGVVVSLLDSNGNDNLPSNYYDVQLSTASNEPGGSGAQPHNANAPIRRYYKEKLGQHPRNWVIAYMPLFDPNTESGMYLNQMIEGAAQTVHGSLYGSGNDAVINQKNTTTGYGYSITLVAAQDWYNIFQSLLRFSEAKNLVYFGHGNPDFIGSGGLGFLAVDIQNIILQNAADPLHGVNSHWYRFVFLDGCYTASGGLPEAFGIPKEVIPDNDWNNKYKLKPRAFLGWKSAAVLGVGTSAGPTQIDQSRVKSMATFWQAWSGYNEDGTTTGVVPVTLQAAVAQIKTAGHNTLTLWGSPSLPFYQ